MGAFWGVSNAIVILILSIFIWGGLAIPVFLYKWIKEKNYKMFGSLVLFIIAILLFIVGEYFAIFTSNLFHWFTFLLVASLGLNCCRLLMQSVKENQKNMMIPYGPALILGALIVIFFL